MQLCESNNSPAVAERLAHCPGLHTVSFFSFFLFLLIGLKRTLMSCDCVRSPALMGIPATSEPCVWLLLPVVCVFPLFSFYLFIYFLNKLWCADRVPHSGAAVFLSSSSSSSWETLTSEKSSPAAQPSWEFPPFYFSLSVRCVESRLLCKQLAPPPSVLSPLARHRQLALYKLITVNCVPPLHNQLMWPTQNSQVCFCACVCVRACDLAGHPLNQSCHGDAALK